MPHENKNIVKLSFPTVCSLLTDHAKVFHFYWYYDIFNWDV